MPSSVIIFHLVRLGSLDIDPSVMEPAMLWNWMKARSGAKVMLFAHGASGYILPLKRQGWSRGTYPPFHVDTELGAAIVRDILCGAGLFWSTDIRC